jgi:hypothetical protein
VASAAPQEAVLVGGEVLSGDLTAIAEGRASFSDASVGAGSRSFPLEQIVRWGNPVAPRAQTIVVLAGGGQLVTAPDWAGGAAVRLDGDAVVVLSDTFGEVRLPRRVVSGVVFAQRRNAEERAELVEKVRSPALADGGRATTDDAVLLTNQDRTSGRLTELRRGSLTIETASGKAKLPLSRVETIEFGGGRQSSAVSRQARFAVGLRDGSLIDADEIAANDKELMLRASAGWKAKGAVIDDVVFIQSLGGPFVYLSDLEPLNYRQVPYLSIEWPYERNRNVAGGPLVVGGRPYLKGIGMHSASRITYKLEGKYTRFDAAVAIDDSADGRGSVTFAVYTMRNGQLQEAFKSDIVRGGEAPVPVSVDVSGAEALTLTVDYADRGDEMDRADWLDAMLVKH